MASKRITVLNSSSEKQSTQEYQQEHIELLKAIDWKLWEIYKLLKKPDTDLPEADTSE